MIEQNVQVVRCQDERLWVRLGSQSGCSACDNGTGCGAGLFTKLLRQKQVVLELARGGIDVVPGQMLTLSFPEQVYMKLVFTYYGWPLLAALVGASAGYGLSFRLGFGPALVDAATLVAGLLAGFFVLHLVKKRNTAETLLKSLQTTICNPSATPKMCKTQARELDRF